VRLDRYEDFITEEERLSLIDWMDNSGKLVPGLSRGEFGYSSRKTTRLNEETILFPKEAYAIQKRIMDLYGFRGGDVERVAKGSGMISVVTYPGGDTYKHTDPILGNKHAMRANIILQNAEEGGELYVAGEHISLKEKELHCYCATKHEHWVTEVKGDKTRYIWIFGFEVDGSLW